MKKKDEEAFILENLFEGVYFVDQDRTISSWNSVISRSLDVS
jgi:hypothetical protein